MNCQIKEILFGSDEYQDEINLRFKILREPLGLQFTESELSQDRDDFHLGLYFDHNLIGCLILQNIDNNTVKMRQVAVDFQYQNKGYGKLLVQKAEEIAQQKKYSKIILNARETAIQFYLSMNYSICSDVLTEVKIPHRKMEKRIN